MTVLAPEGTDRDELRRVTAELSAIERPSASEGERRAADWIADWFREAGLEPRVEREQAHGGFWWPIGLLNALAVLAARLRSRLLALVALVLLVDDVDHRSRAFRKLLPKRPTWNVTAETGDPSARRTIVLVAHHDAAHGGLVYDSTPVYSLLDRFPQLLKRAKRWPPMMWGVVIGPLLVALGRRRAGAICSLGTIAAMADIARSPITPGANDNLAAVASLLVLARRRYEGIRVIFVSTGSEESLSEGMQAWGRRHFPSLPPETTTFVALETLGSGNVTIAEREGFLVPHPYTAEVKDALERAGHEVGVPVRRGVSNSFASDGQIPVLAGYRTALLGALDDYLLPTNYHQPSDLPENLDWECVENAVRLLDAFLRAEAD
jgi:acetylornithine deacetylase/succinyl-diaminopimelate desuccinylase-like protein